MAIHPNEFKKKYANLSIEELEAEYENLKKDYCFDSKEEQIDYLIKTYLYASHKTNTNSKRVALEELLKEKTGREYTFDDRFLEITPGDIINHVTNPREDPFWTTKLINFFNSLQAVPVADKNDLLIGMLQDRSIFNEFTKDIVKSNDVRGIYERYKEIVRNYRINNSIKS